METPIASSSSIGKEEVFDPTYESNVYFDWRLDGCAMEMEVDKEEGAMDVVVSEPKSQQESVCHAKCKLMGLSIKYCAQKGSDLNIIGREIKRSDPGNRSPQKGIYPSGIDHSKRPNRADFYSVQSDHNLPKRPVFRRNREVVCGNKVVR
ncbi:hypothetical protein RHMOL_Rhmol04G0044300 [Rhododendron molle]|uniref:Uncharacterized protein n=1 Tax=Rhododendron molle TaxID=49168 RepID=A0ACC0NX19_RHOML|nr:hypothetical protein RHMOL_Rhmol04G0044300 [Rhododendron molle]